MKKNALTIAEAGKAYLSGFLISQITVIIFSFLSMTILLLFNVSNINEIMESSPIYISLLSLVMQLSFLAVYLYIKFNYDLKPNTIFKRKVNVWQILLYVLVGIFTIFALSGVINYFELFLKFIKFPIAEMPFEINTWVNYLLAVGTLVIAPAFCEELLFRGIIFQGLRQKNDTFAIFMSAIMFSVFHLSATQFLYPFLFGILLAIIMLKTKNIWYCIIVHGVNNLFTVTLQFLTHNQSGVQFVHNNVALFSAIVLALLWVLLVVFIFFDKKLFKNKEQDEIVEKQKISKKSKLIFASSIVIMVIMWSILFISELL